MKRAFTLTELVAVLAVGGAVTGLLTPALYDARERARATTCLDSLRQLGSAVHWYNEVCGALPGPLHPAVYHGMDETLTGDPAGEAQRNRHLTWKLRAVVGAAMNDRLVTCPTTARIDPDEQFAQYVTFGRLVRPTHYALNNPGTSDGSGASGGARETSPANYFGLSNLPGYGSHPIVAIPNPQREWLIADAWYRRSTNPAFPQLQQDGPYQLGWTGEALPNFAPHQRRTQAAYRYVTSAQRDAESSSIRAAKQDGVTNTLFVDGHASGIASRTLTVNGFELLYGFPGTVNPATPLPNGAIWR